MEIITASVHDMRGVIETRLAAIYTMIHWAACAVAVSTDPEVYEAERPVLLQLFASARPALRTFAPACIHELWDMRLDVDGRGP
jgi:hypothetical protein